MSPLAIALIVLGVIVFICLFFASYVKAAPDEAIIISGARKEPKILIGKSGIRIPFLQRKDTLSLKLMSITINKSDAVPTMDYVNVKVNAVVTAKISDKEDKLKAAAQNFLNMEATGRNASGKQNQQQGIADMIDNILDGSLREIIGQIDLETLVRKRNEVAEKVMTSAVKDLDKLGIVLETFNIQSFTDDVVDPTTGKHHSMIEDLGAEKTSVIIKNAAISRAKASAETRIAESENDRIANEQEVANGLIIETRKNDLAIKKHELAQIEQTKKADADAAYAIQEQKRQKEINVAQADAEVAKQEKEIEIRERMVAVTEKELQANIEKKAEANRKAQIQESDAELYKQQKAAEANLFAKQKEAESIELVAKANRQKAIYEADAVKAAGIAEGEAIQAKGLAEAAAIDKKADAMKKYGGAAIQEMQLKTVEAYFKVMPEIAGQLAVPFSKIGEINMYGQGNMQNLAGGIMNTFTQVNDALRETAGINIGSILNSFLGAKMAGAGQNAQALEEVTDVASGKDLISKAFDNSADPKAAPQKPAVQPTVQPKVAQTNKTQAKTVKPNKFNGLQFPDRNWEE